MIEAVVIAGFQPAYQKKLIEQFGSTYRFTFTHSKNLAALQQAEVIIGNPATAIVETLPKLKFLQLTSAGYDCYQFLLEKPSPFAIAHIEKAFGITIAEYVIGAILARYRHFYQYHQLQKQHCWQDVGPEETLYGKNVLVLGTGDIGQNIAKRLTGFDCWLTGLNSDGRAIAYFNHTDALDQLNRYLPSTDILICTLPANPKTLGLLDEATLQRLKHHALLVNVSRGQILTEKALEHLVQDDHLAGIISDVFPMEPLPADSPLWDSDKITITPHISGKGFAHHPLTEEKIYQCVQQNLTCYQKGQPLHYRIK